MSERLEQLDTHFAFGKDWASFVELIGERQIEDAIKGLVKWVPAEAFEGRTFLDIGGGSGIHSWAVGRLGVSRILSVDLDPVSVATTQKVLSKSGLSVPWRAERLSVFDLTPDSQNLFGIVYSWGVLHHTGDSGRLLTARRIWLRQADS